MSKLSTLLLIITISISSGLFFTSELTEGAMQTSAKSPEFQIKSQLKKLDPDLSITSVTKSPIPNLYEVLVEGGFVIYSSENGQYLLKGDMLEIRDGKLVNLSEEIKNQAVAQKLKLLNTEDMIIFAPPGKKTGVVYAFTDVDCGYCRKLHQEIAELNRSGVELRYLAFPRGGINSAAYKKMTDAWCAVDKKQALTDLKTNKSISVDIKDDKVACRKIVSEQYNLGVHIGINGTPAMVLENGQIITGYRPAADIVKVLDNQSS